jgi:uncharacterized protein with GYD domain
VALQSVRLTNFRGFRDHTVSLDPVSILVGQNNAGKSTFIDAVRLLAVGVRRATSATYGPLPNWLAGHSEGFGFTTSFETVDFDFENIHRNLENADPAKLVLNYRNRSRVVLWFGRDATEVFFQIFRPRLGAIASRAEALGANLTPILVMPPIGPLLPHEKVIARNRVREFLYGRLAHRHFRNQLLEFPPQYRRWRDLLSETWPSARVESFESDHGEAANELSLVIRDGGFASEAAWMGSGIQAWMQLIWFLCRADREAIVVLDEPDVYLHADLQRKIIKLIATDEFLQVVVATHSPEIISDVEPGAITVIRKKSRYSSKPAKIAEVQDLIDDLGSRHNLQLSKLGAARRVVLYEGDDQRYLSQVAMSLGSDKYSKFMEIPYFDIKGVENWQQAIGVARILQVATEGQVQAYLIIDRDFKTEEDLLEIKNMANRHGLIFHAWSRKEIENYFISSTVLSRYISRCGHTHLDENAADVLIEEAAGLVVHEAIQVIATRFRETNRGSNEKDAQAHAENTFEAIRAGRSLHHVVSGKRLISTLSRLAKQRYGCQLNAMNLCREFSAGEWDAEIREITAGIAA